MRMWMMYGSRGDGLIISEYALISINLNIPLVYPSYEMV